MGFMIKLLNSARKIDEGYAELVERKYAKNKTIRVLSWRQRVELLDDTLAELAQAAEAAGSYHDAYILEMAAGIISRQLSPYNDEKSK